MLSPTAFLTVTLSKGLSIERQTLITLTAVVAVMQLDWLTAGRQPLQYHCIFTLHTFMQMC